MGMGCPSLYNMETLISHRERWCPLYSTVLRVLGPGRYRVRGNHPEPCCATSEGRAAGGWSTQHRGQTSDAGARPAASARLLFPGSKFLLSLSSSVEGE